MRRGLSQVRRSFRDLVRRRGYPINVLQANDASRSPEFSKATKRARGYDSDGTVHGLPVTVVNTIGVRQVGDSEFHLELAMEGMRVRGDCALYLPPEVINPATPYATTGTAFRPKITDEFVVLPGTANEQRYAVAGRDYESLEAYNDPMGDPIMYVVWCELLQHTAVPATEPSWQPGVIS